MQAHFIFFANIQTNAKKIKRAYKPTHVGQCKLDTTALRTERSPAHNRVARPTQNYVGTGSHTTVHADLAYGGSLCIRVAHECLFRADFHVVVEQ